MRKRKPSIITTVLNTLFEADATGKKVPKNMGKMGKHKEAIKKKLQGGTDEPAAPDAKVSKNTSKTAKHRDAIKQKLQGSVTDEPAAGEATAEAAGPDTKVPKNMGKMGKHRAAISASLRQKNDTTGLDPDAKPYDDIEVPEETDADITGEDAVDAADEAVAELEDREEEIETQQDEKNQSRLLSIDKTKINKELKVLTLQAAPAIPINSIKDILKKFKLKLIDDKGHDADIKLIGVDGNTDIELAYENGKRINNSAMVLYWHQIDRSDLYEFHCYLS